VEFVGIFSLSVLACYGLVSASMFLALLYFMAIDHGGRVWTWTQLTVYSLIWPIVLLEAAREREADLTFADAISITTRYDEEDEE